MFQTIIMTFAKKYMRGFVFYSCVFTAADLYFQTHKDYKSRLLDNWEERIIISTIWPIAIPMMCMGSATTTAEKVYRQFMFFSWALLLII